MRAPPQTGEHVSGRCGAPQCAAPRIVSIASSRPTPVSWLGGRAAEVRHLLDKASHLPRYDAGRELEPYATCATSHATSDADPRLHGNHPRSRRDPRGSSTPRSTAGGVVYSTDGQVRPDGVVVGSARPARLDPQEALARSRRAGAAARDHRAAPSPRGEAVGEAERAVGQASA